MKITDVQDCGTIVAVVTENETIPFEHRAYRELEAARGGVDNIIGAEVEINTDNAGEKYVRFLDEPVVCPNCHAAIPPEYNPDMCVFGRHPRKAVPNH